MTVLAVYGPLTGSQQLDVTVDGIKTASLVYKVVTDSAMSLPAILADPVVSASGIGAGYPLNPDMYIAHVGIKDMSDNVIAYDLTLDYTNERDLDPNPLLEPARISWSGEYYQRPNFRDRYGKSLITKSGEYPEGLYEDEVQLNFNVSKNVATVPAWVLAASGSVNVSPFMLRGLTFDSELCRLGIITGSDELTRNGFTFYKISIPISYRAKGWKTEFLHRGFYQKSASGDIIPCVDANWQAVSTPAMLDIDGLQITSPTVDNAVVLEFDTKQAFDFNELPLT